jgi:hypothetical protein
MIAGKKVNEISTSEQDPLLVVKIKLEGGREIFIKRETFYKVDQAAYKDDPATEKMEKHYSFELLNLISAGLITLSPSFIVKSF